MLNAKQYGQALWQANINDGINPNSNNVSYQFDWGVVNGNPTLNKVLVPEYLDAAQTLKSSNTDWYDAISHELVLPILMTFRYLMLQTKELCLFSLGIL